MKKILGLIASQRKLANGEILTKEVAAAAGDDCQLELLRLADLRLDLCRGCYACLTPGKQCPVDDDLYFLVEKIKAADGIILAAPCYIIDLIFPLCLSFVMVLLSKHNIYHKNKLAGLVEYVPILRAYFLR